MALFSAIRHVIAILLFPGVIVHEAAHVLLCKLFGVRVYDVRYFSIGKRMGYVEHDRSPVPLQDTLIGLGPLLINPLVGFGLGALLLNVTWRHLLQGPIYLIYCWLGLSVATMGAPSFSDVSEARHLAIWGNSAITRIVSSCLMSLALVGAIASVFLLDLVCGVAVFFAPTLIWK